MCDHLRGRDQEYFRSSANATNNTIDYAREFRNSTPIEQDILNALAMLHIPVNIDEVLKYLELSESPNLTKSVNKFALFNILSDLLDRKLVIQGNDPSRYQLCHELWQELFFKHISMNLFETCREVCMQVVPTIRQLLEVKHPKDLKITLDSDLLLLVVRDAVYRNQLDKSQLFLNFFTEKSPKEIEFRHPYLEIFDRPFRDAWFQGLQINDIAKIQLSLLELKISRLTNPSYLTSSLEKLYDQIKDNQLQTQIYEVLSFTANLRDKSERTKWRVLQQDQSRYEAWNSAIRAFQLMLEGNFETAAFHFHRTWRDIREDKEKVQSFINHPLSAFFMLCVFKQRHQSIQNMQILNLLRKWQAQSEGYMRRVYDILDELLTPQFNKEATPTEYAEVEIDQDGEANLGFGGTRHISWFFEALYCLWHYGEDYTPMIKPLRRILDRAQRNGYVWLSAEISHMIFGLDPKDISMGEDSHRLHERIGSQSLLSILPIKMGWRKFLDRLQEIDSSVDQSGRIATAASDQRLIWFLKDIDPKQDTKEFPFEPYIQYQNHPQANKIKGTLPINFQRWQKVSKARLRDLYEAHKNEEAFLTPQDHKICAQILVNGTLNRSDWEVYQQDKFFKFDYHNAYLAIVGHPLLFKENEKQQRFPVSVELSKPQIKVIYPNERYISLSFKPNFDELPEIKEDESFLYEERKDTLITLIECKPIHRKIAEMIKQEVKIPKSEQLLLNQTMDQISNYVSIQSDIGQTDDLVEIIEASANLIVLFLPTDDGVRLQLRVQPSKQSSNLLRVGEGGKSLSMSISGRRVRIERNLQAELDHQKRLLEECKVFTKLKPLPAGDWLVENKLVYLDLIYALKDFEDFVTIQWTEKQQVKIEPKAIKYDQFKSISINRTNQNWFQIDGDIILNDQIKMSLRELLEKERIGRFIPLETGGFVALSDEVLTLIDHLSEVSESSSQGIRFMESFASPVISALGELNDLTQSDRYWKNIKNQLKSIENPSDIPIPSSLKAELRDYQYEGFRWLYVNAQLNLGVCLADDMGLGKTLQALTLLLSRAKLGPSLVIAPTSVVHNWLNQAAKYAPELNMIKFGGPKANRIKQIEELGIKDVVVCTYGLLKYEVDLISRPRWSNVILDEAQNIKNHTTKSAQAAMKLKADFRFATTGTPIENNLNELWSLFQFLNPAILKSNKWFKDKYANPIEKDNDLDARQKLNRLISPFILRRTKENVLKDLPPITEITLSVNLSEKERQVYEGLKSERMEEIQTMLALGDHKARMKLFALLTQLRQVCCNTKLVLPKLDISSAKLAAFEGLVHRLIENGHKVLVFSQFVRHLDILKACLEEKNINYQYLVGDTPMNERQQRVDAFQSGVGDVFLISLKAGGVGLNLTAADYVIHMDPWWNPAVEDQASDRAHRIGQQKPVTVYRLVAKDTIEEQIVALHQSKKDLADAILDGSENANLINADQIFDLLKEESVRYQDHMIDDVVEADDDMEVF